jgi:hypothetical protein
MLARKAAALSFLSSISTVSPSPQQQPQPTDGAQGAKGSIAPMRVLSSPAEVSEGEWTPKQLATISFLRNIELGSSHPVSESSGLSRALSHSLEAFESPRPIASSDAAEIPACPIDVFAGAIVHIVYYVILGSFMRKRSASTTHHLVAARTV